MSLPSEYIEVYKLFQTSLVVSTTLFLHSHPHSYCCGGSLREDVPLWPPLAPVGSGWAWRTMARMRRWADCKATYATQYLTENGTKMALLQQYVQHNYMSGTSLYKKQL